jgi:Heterogeneous nuclear ribonucleoprotein Q acidic domain
VLRRIFVVKDITSHRCCVSKLGRMDDATPEQHQHGPSSGTEIVAVDDTTQFDNQNEKDEPPLKRIKLEDEVGQFSDATTSVLDHGNIVSLSVAEETTGQTAPLLTVAAVPVVEPVEAETAISSYITDVQVNDVAISTEDVLAVIHQSSISDNDPTKVESIATSTLPVENEEDDDLFGGGDDDDNDDDIVITTKVLEEKPLAVPEAAVPSEPPLVLVNEGLVPVEAIPEVPSLSEIETPKTAVAGSSDETKTESEVATSPELAIPRKSSSSSAKTYTAVTNNNSNSGQTQHYTPGTRYGLPPGVNVPVSIVRTKLLEVEMNTPGSKLMDVLKSLPINLINDALTEYDDAVEIKGTNSIRNHGAYLYGVVKRYVSVHDRSMKGEGTGILPMGEDGLTVTVQARLDQLVASGFCSNQEMNDKVKSKIRMLSENDAIFALDELSSVDRMSIRNFGSYFMGILNRYMRGDASSKIRPSSLGPGSGGNGPSHHHPHHQKQGHLQNRERDRFTPHHQQQQQQLSSSSSSYRSPSGPRDRFDNRGAANSMNGQRPPPYRVENSAYDHRLQHQPSSQLPSWQNQQQPPPHQLMGSGGVPPMHHGGGGGSNMPHLSMNPANTMAPSIVPNNQSIPGMPQTNVNYPGQQLQQPYLPQQQQPPYMQQQQQQQHPNFGHQPVYPPNNNVQHGTPNNNITGMYQPQGNMMGQQQPHIGSQTPQQQQQHLPYPTQQQPAMMNQPSQFVTDPMGQSHGSIDILGLADKAASAIQALGANKLNHPIGQGYPTPHMGVPPQQQQQQPGYPPYMGGIPMMGQQPQIGMQQQQQQQPNLPPHQTYPPPHQPFGGPGSLNRTDAPMNQQQQQGARRRTTASFSELPVTVQYALQVS